MGENTTVKVPNDGNSQVKGCNCPKNVAQPKQPAAPKKPAATKKPAVQPDISKPKVDPQLNPTIQYVQECKPCQSWGSKIGNFMGRFVGRPLSFGWDILKGIFGGLKNSFSCQPTYCIQTQPLIFQPTVQQATPQFITCAQPVVQQVMPQLAQPNIVSFMSPFSYSCTPTYYSSGGNNFLAGALFGSLFNRGHHHCHGGGQPIVVNRHINISHHRPLWGGCHWGRC